MDEKEIGHLIGEDMKALHNTVFPGHVTGNLYEYRGVGIFQHGTRFRIDFATGNRWVLSLESAKRVIDSVLKHQYKAI